MTASKSRVQPLFHEGSKARDIALFIWPHIDPVLRVISVANARSSSSTSFSKSRVVPKVVISLCRRVKYVEVLAVFVAI